MNIQIWIDGGALSAFGGAFIGGVFVIIGGWLVHYWQQKARKEKEREILRNVLRALELEFEEFWESYKISLGLIRSEYPKGEHEVFYFIKQEYFTVYKGNVHMFSQLHDKELQRLIIQAYMAFSSLLDKIESRNKTINRKEEYLRLNISSNEEIYLKQAEFLENELKKMAVTLQEHYLLIDRLMNALIPKLNETIQSLQ
jgi:hypothetical protein